MKKTSYRKYIHGALHHVYTRGIDSSVMFYSVQDCLFYITLYSCMANQYDIACAGMCLMPNHTHSLETAPSEDRLQLFHQELNSMYARIFNSYHRRTGPLFYRSFNYAPKTVGKKIRDCLSYIINNPVVGNLAEYIMDYRWNMAAYYRQDYPFSKRIDFHKAPLKIRVAANLIRQLKKQNRPITYQVQNTIFSSLNKDEVNQLIDFILMTYNPVEKDITSRCYGSIDNALMVMRANSGSEYDIPEDYEDYSIYRKMTRQMVQSGFRVERCDFLNFPETERRKLIPILVGIGASQRQAENYLHLSHK